MAERDGTNDPPGASDLAHHGGELLVRLRVPGMSGIPGLESLPVVIGHIVRVEPCDPLARFVLDARRIRQLMNLAHGSLTSLYRRTRAARTSRAPVAMCFSTVFADMPR